MSRQQQDQIRMGREGAGDASGPRSDLVVRFHQIFDPSELAREIQQLRGASTSTDRSLDDEFGWSAEAHPASLSSEDGARLRALERIAADPRGHRRRSIAGSRKMVHRLEALSAAMPHFAPAIDLVARAALVSARTSMPLRLPPILLLGEPGIGKTYTLRRLAEAIGADFSMVGVNITDAFLLRGLNTAWRGAKMGRVAEILLGATTAPVILADEFDKAVGDQIHRPYDTWYSLLDPENSAAFKDDYLQIRLHADQIIWCASANDLSPIPAPILDRFLILEIQKPDYDQLRRIVTSVYSSSRQAYGGAVAEHLSEELVHELAKHNPRRLGMLIDLAVGFAAADGRRSLSVDDVRRAERLAGGNDNGFRRRVGFVPCRLEPKQSWYSV